ncbi:MAG: 3-phosphoshikimate 1-carboxyvinyltransferase [Candidatus Poseidoniales archaeon]|jgi:3-phosphoshikimate 1-carboxyvinyltransferase|tara:strand:- start:1854 stop:2981 length:1128 start_codon:yes stop_codon:yes gene_type:complete
MSRDIITVFASELSGVLELPCSKSHALRWLILAANDPSPTRIIMSELGEDVESMIGCLEKLGIRYDSNTIYGGELTEPSSALDVGNSGTALRFLIAQCATCNFEVLLDGDDSLRLRSSRGLCLSLSLDGDKVPLYSGSKTVEQNIEVDVSNSSQFLSALLLATPRMDGARRISTIGRAVSRRHSDLTWRLCQETGAKDWGQPWLVKCPDEVMIPADASMMAFALLAGMNVSNPPAEEDSLGHEVLFQSGDVYDLRDANDLVPPLAAHLCLTSGGVIRGAAHASLKESNRLSRTVELLHSFGLEVEEHADGFNIRGNQRVLPPNEVVKTHGDHRLQMTALILGLQVGAQIEGAELHRVAWPSFVEQLSALGAKIQP